MDEETNKLLRQLLDSQREQTELLRKHLPPLWTRVRFSLLGLLLLMTLAAAGLGFTVWQIRKPSGPPTITLSAPMTPLPVSNNPSGTWSSTGTLTLNGSPSLLLDIQKVDAKVVPSESK